MSLRSSTGRSNEASRFPCPAGRTTNALRRSAKPSGSKRAHGAGRRCRCRCAAPSPSSWRRRSRRRRAPAAGGRAALRTPSSCDLRMVLPRARHEISSPRPVSTPSDSQGDLAVAGGLSGNGRPWRVRGFNAIDRIGLWRDAGAVRRAPAPAGIRVMSRFGSDSGTSAMARRSLSALAISSSAALILTSQSRCGAPAVVEHDHQAAPCCRRAPVCGFQIGPAAAKMNEAPRAKSRSAVSHHGVREGVSSVAGDVEQQAASAETRCGAAAAASRAAATTAPAG